MDKILKEEEKTKLNKLLLNIGFEGEGGFKKAPKSHLLGNLNVTKVKNLKENNKEDLKKEIKKESIFKSDLNIEKLNNILKSLDNKFIKKENKQESNEIFKNQNIEKIINILKNIGE